MEVASKKYTRTSMSTGEEYVRLETWHIEEALAFGYDKLREFFGGYISYGSRLCNYVLTHRVVDDRRDGEVVNIATYDTTVESLLDCIPRACVPSDTEYGRLFSAMLAREKAEAEEFDRIKRVKKAEENERAEKWRKESEANKCWNRLNDKDRESWQNMIQQYDTLSEDKKKKLQEDEHFMADYRTAITHTCVPQRRAAMKRVAKSVSKLFAGGKAP